MKTRHTNGFVLIQFSIFLLLFIYLFKFSAELSLNLNEIQINRWRCLMESKKILINKTNPQTLIQNFNSHFKLIEHSNLSVIYQFKKIFTCGAQTINGDVKWFYREMVRY